jgi:hypothetical protein
MPSLWLLSRACVVGALWGKVQHDSSSAAGKVAYTVQAKQLCDDTVCKATARITAAATGMLMVIICCCAAQRGLAHIQCCIVVGSPTPLLPEYAKDAFHVGSTYGKDVGYQCCGSCCSSMCAACGGSSCGVGVATELPGMQDLHLHPVTAVVAQGCSSAAGKGWMVSSSTP